MSTEPAETLLQAAAEADGIAAAVEAHLDHHPLPADEARVQQIAARLERRIRPRPAVPWRPVLALALLAALALIALRAATAERIAPTDLQPEPAPEALSVDKTGATRVVAGELPESIQFEQADRVVEVAPDSAILASEVGRTVVLLVQSGGARTGGVEIPAGHWAVLAADPGPAGPAESPPTVVFPDGHRPPAAVQQGVFAESAVPAQLRELRWASLPDRTLQTLDTLLETP